MVIAKEMKNAVNQKLREPFLRLNACHLPLSLSGFNGDDHITKKLRRHRGKLTLLHGKGDHIRGAASIEIFFVEYRYLGIISDEDGKFAIRTTQGV